MTIKPGACVKIRLTGQALTRHRIFDAWFKVTKEPKL